MALKRMLDLQGKTKELAAGLIRRGYRRVSWSGRISRIDRPDWRLHPGMDGISGPGAEDFYRRVYSKDILVVSKDVIRLIPTSCHDPVGYIDYETL